MQPRKLVAGSACKCTLGCPLLDKLLNGGFSCGGVTELVGLAAVAAEAPFHRLEIIVRIIC